MGGNLTRLRRMSLFRWEGGVVSSALFIIAPASKYAKFHHLTHRRNGVAYLLAGLIIPKSPFKRRSALRRSEVNGNTATVIF
jgi:hypothetical protein